MNNQHLSTTNNTTQFNVPGAPDSELTRSPAAATVGLLAEESQLELAHFEYRVQLAPPEHWLPKDRPDLGEIAPWQNGVLPENKYQGFRNDQMIGSFHPGHRAKWTAHELCHGLVGFAWRPDASTFFHALAARLSELLPVALFYFFDEAYLRRCPDHEGGGPLFGTFCRRCEAYARKGAREDDNASERFMKEGRAFVERELAAILKSQRVGRPISSPWANLDLMSDGLAYAAAQGKRLTSPQFQRYMYLFFPDGRGLHPSLEALEARVVEVLNGICIGAAVDPLKGDRWTWRAQDIGWRLLEVSSECEQLVSRRLVHLVEKLAASPSEATMGEVIDGYVALNDEYELPSPEDLFAVGYPLPRGYGRSRSQISEGIASACPTGWELLGETGRRDDLVREFCLQDAHIRLPVTTRFVSWLASRESGDAVDMMRFEAAVAHTKPVDMSALTLDQWPRRPEMWVCAEDVTLLRTSDSLIQALSLDHSPGDDVPFLAIRRDTHGETNVIQLSGYLGEALLAMQREPKHIDQLSLSEVDMAQLTGNRLAVPHAWSDSRPSILMR